MGRTPKRGNARSRAAPTAERLAAPPRADPRPPRPYPLPHDPSPQGPDPVLVASAGFAIRTPLARVPENSMKFVVGVMLTAFGTFWGAEGAQAHWPHAEASLLVLVPAIGALALTLVAVLRWQRARQPETPNLTGVRA